jgi:hypothetical protein
LELTKYSITSGTGAQANDPKDWIFKGSNDGGATWTIHHGKTSSLSVMGRENHYGCVAANDFFNNLGYKQTPGG